MKPGLTLLAGIAAIVMAGTGSLSAQPIGQWDFINGNLNATVGSAMTYKDGEGGATDNATQFNTTTGFGIPDIGGQPAPVMRVPGLTEDFGTGYYIPIPSLSNGGGSLLNDYTLVMDVLFPASSAGTQRALLETDLGIFNPDAEFFVESNNRLGLKGASFGNVTPDTWHRLGIVVDATAGQMRFYLDGIEQGVVRDNNMVDQRYALSPDSVAEIFADDSGETAVAYVSSIQLRDQALSKGQMLALGGPTADGIPQQLPPVPSGIERWIPRGTYASRATPIGAVINPGDTTIQDASISLSLDGTPVASPTITRENNLITVQKTDAGLALGPHTLVLTLTDSLAGEKSFTNTFTATLFFEDFENVPLEPQKEEGTSFEGPAWTHTPPAGWTVDNSDFLATIIDPENNPDSDEDGYADLDGRTEWAGWSFAVKEFWVAADDQRRSEFAFADGVVAIADSDEWDDSAHVPSLFNSYLSTPPIPIDGVAANSLFLSFASSWRDEALDDSNASSFLVGPNGEAINNQTAIITASFNGGEPIEIFKWDSAPGSPTFHDDNPNEMVLVPVPNPADATNVVFTFRLELGANDWWWAIDNVAVGAGGTPPVISQHPVSVEVNEGATTNLTVSASGDDLTYQWFKGQGSDRTAIAGATTATYTIPSASLESAGYYSVDISNTYGSASSEAAKVTVIPGTANRRVLLSEDFEGLELGPSVDEGVPGDEVWTKTPPAGWTIDDSGVPGAGTDDDGVTEWAGWSFALRTWWAETAEDQRRSQFTKGTGTSAIVDSDEWDDISHAAGNMASYLSTPPISLEGVAANSVIVKFDSSWRPESTQTANVRVSFDGGAPVEVLRFESDTTSANYHPDEVNETVVFRLNNPDGATNMVLTFGYFDTRNNWWWAIDNVLVLEDSSGGGGDGPEIGFSVANGQLSLTWTGDGFVLHENADIANAAGWAPVAGAGPNSATVPIADGQSRFYRLQK